MGHGRVGWAAATIRPVTSPERSRCQIFWVTVGNSDSCPTLIVDTQPDTHVVDRSEIRTQILLATASSDLKGKTGFTHMLTEVRTPFLLWYARQVFPAHCCRYSASLVALRRNCS